MGLGRNGRRSGSKPAASGGSRLIRGARPQREGIRVQTRRIGRVTSDPRCRLEVGRTDLLGVWSTCQRVCQLCKWKRSFSSPPERQRCWLHLTESMGRQPFTSIAPAVASLKRLNLSQGTKFPTFTGSSVLWMINIRKQIMRKLWLVECFRQTLSSMPITSLL
jgi:hypothetical protein